MTPAERNEVRALILFYEYRGWDWSEIAEFLIRKYNGTLSPQVVRTAIGCVGRKPARRKRNK